MANRNSLEYRFHTVEKDLKSIINDCAEFVACDPDEAEIMEFNSNYGASRSSFRIRRSRSLSPTTVSRRCTRDILYSPGLQNRQFALFNRLPKELRLQIWEMSVVPEVVIGRLVAKDGKVGNSVALDNFSGRQLIPFESSITFGTKSHYKKIRLYEINSEGRALAIKYWGSPLPPACAIRGRRQHPTYLFRSDTDILAIHLHKYHGLPQGHLLNNFNVTYGISPWKGAGYPIINPPAPLDLLSKIRRIELQLDRVEDLRDMGYNWTGSRQANPFTFLFHFPNLQHLTFVFRRPHLADIPHTRNGKTLIDNINMVFLPVTEAVQRFDYYHADTIHCLHAFSRLFKDCTTRHRAKTLLRKLQTIEIKANPDSLALDPYYFPENIRPIIPIARLPKGTSPLAWARSGTLEIVPHEVHMGVHLDEFDDHDIQSQQDEHLQNVLAGLHIQPFELVHSSPTAMMPLVTPMLPSALIQQGNHHPQQQQQSGGQQPGGQPQPGQQQPGLTMENPQSFTSPGQPPLTPMTTPMPPSTPHVLQSSPASPAGLMDMHTATGTPTTAATASAASLSSQQAAAAMALGSQLQAWAAQQEEWQVNNANASEAGWSVSYLNPED